MQFIVFTVFFLFMVFIQQKFSNRFGDRFRPDYFGLVRNIENAMRSGLDYYDIDISSMFYRILSFAVNVQAYISVTRCMIILNNNK